MDNKSTLYYMLELDRKKVRSLCYILYVCDKHNDNFLSKLRYKNRKGPMIFDERFGHLDRYQ